MKKFINAVENVEQEMLAGIAKAHPEYVQKLPDFNVLVRTEKKEGKVALVSGGGLPTMRPDRGCTSGSTRSTRCFL